MLVDGNSSPHRPDHMRDGRGFEAGVSTGQKVETYGKQVYYWDLMGPCRCKDGAVYIRFRDRNDPNMEDTARRGVEIVDQSWIAAKPARRRSGCIIKGPKASHNAVEDCRLVASGVTIEGALPTSFATTRSRPTYSPMPTGRGATLAGDAIPTTRLILFYNQYKMSLGQTPRRTTAFGRRGQRGREPRLQGGQGFTSAPARDARARQRRRGAVQHRHHRDLGQGSQCSGLRQPGRRLEHRLPHASRERKRPDRPARCTCIAIVFGNRRAWARGCFPLP